jgi:hypothetical protein
MWHGKEINFNHSGILPHLGPGLGTLMYEFLNYVFRKKHVAVDKSKISPANFYDWKPVADRQQDPAISFSGLWRFFR